MSKLFYLDENEFINLDNVNWIRVLTTQGGGVPNVSVRFNNGETQDTYNYDYMGIRRRLGFENPNITRKADDGNPTAPTPQIVHLNRLIP